MSVGGSVAFRYAVTTFIGLSSDNGTVVSCKCRVSAISLMFRRAKDIFCGVGNAFVTQYPSNVFRFIFQLDVKNLSKFLVLFFRSDCVEISLKFSYHDFFFV